MIVTTTHEPTYKPDVIAVTGLDLAEIERRIRTARMISRAEPISWPRDPAGLARDLLDEGGVAGFTTRAALAEALVAETDRRLAAGADRLAAGWRSDAAHVATARAAGLDAVGDATAAACRVEHAAAEALGAAAEFDVPRMSLRWAGR